MRSLLLNVENNNWDDIPEMDSSTRNNLLKKHKEYHRKSMRVWLNTFFGFGTDKAKWHQAPGFQLAFAIVLLLGVIFTFQNIVDTDKNLADANIEEAENIPPKISNERVLKENKSQTNELKNLESVDIEFESLENEIEMSDKIGSSYSDENKVESHTNSNITDMVAENIGASDNAYATLIMDNIRVDKDQNDIEPVDEMEPISQEDESDQNGFLNNKNVIAENDNSEMQNAINTSKTENLIDDENISADEVFEVEENSLSNSGLIEQFPKNSAEIEIMEKKLSEKSIASERSSDVMFQRKEIKTLSRSGISLNVNSEIINQLFTAY
jgi:hypothetical protein